MRIKTMDDFELNPKIEEALVDVITGGRGHSKPYPFAVYRSGNALTRFFRSLGHKFYLGMESRTDAVRSLVTKLARENGLLALEELSEFACNDAEIRDQAEKRRKTVDHLNRALSEVNLKMKKVEDMYRLRSITSDSIAMRPAVSKANDLEWDSVQKSLRKAEKRVSSDPEGALTSACSTVESTLRSVLLAAEADMPSKKTISELWKATSKLLNLSSGRDDIDGDVRQVLSGLASIVSGIGALRTHAGDAHGEDPKAPPIDSRIAELSVNAASTLTLFVIQTWEKKSKGGRI